MNLRSWKLMAVVFVGGAALHAQEVPSLVAEAKQAYTSVKTNLLKAAEKMPAESYDFKPTPEIRTFGALMAHIADAQKRNCSAARGEMKQGTAASKTSKEDLVAAMKDSIAECDAAFEALTDANANDLVKFRNGQRRRLAILVYNTGHDMEEYGYAAVYLRLKGLVPPSSEGR
jgi:uncharacterized damage-inducible protein DinB